MRLKVCAWVGGAVFRCTLSLLPVYMPGPSVVPALTLSCPVPANFPHHALLAARRHAPDAAGFGQLAANPVLHCHHGGGHAVCLRVRLSAVFLRQSRCPPACVLASRTVSPTVRMCCPACKSPSPRAFWQVACMSPLPGLQVALAAYRRISPVQALYVSWEWSFTTSSPPTCLQSIFLRS